MACELLGGKRKRNEKEREQSRHRGRESFFVETKPALLKKKEKKICAAIKI